MWVFRCILLILLVGCCTPGYGQGCSDAGFCSAGILKSGTGHIDSQQAHHQLGVSFTVGAGEQQTVVSIAQLELSLQASKSSLIAVSIPLLSASGNLGQHVGLGDPIATISTILGKTGDWTWSALGGIRLGTGNANYKNNGNALPMPYQSSLGTTDVILGATATYRKYLTLALGLQQPVIQYNHNDFITQNYNATSRDTYFSSKHLVRKGDLLLRVERSYSLRKVQLSAGPLFIYHLGRDKILTNTGDQVLLSGSDGLTMNAVVTAGYRLKSVNTSLQFGTPFVVRSYRPDGLTRAWVLTLRING